MALAWQRHGNIKLQLCYYKMPRGECGKVVESPACPASAACPPAAAGPPAGIWRQQHLCGQLVESPASPHEPLWGGAEAPPRQLSSLRTRLGPRPRATPQPLSGPFPLGYPSHCGSVAPPRTRGQQPGRPGGAGSAGSHGAPSQATCSDSLSLGVTDTPLAGTQALVGPRGSL